MRRSKNRPTITRREHYVHIEMDHCLINLWHEMDPQLIEVQPDRGRSGEKEFKAQLNGGDQYNYLNVRIVEQSPPPVTVLCTCDSNRFTMTRAYTVECMVDEDGNDVTTGNLNGWPEQDTPMVCVVCGGVRK